MNPMARNLLIAAVMVVGVGGIVLAQKKSSTAIPTGTATSTSAVTLAEVATHNTRESCWTIINGNAYDLTSWVPQHPGGEAAILQLCGTDGSASFNGQHGGAATQAAILEGFKISETGAAAVAPSVAAPSVGDDNDGSGRGRGRGGDDD